MCTNIIIEMAPFQVAKGVSDEALIQASKVVEQDFLSQQKGFIKRELLKTSDRQWMDVVYWASETDARTATENASQCNTHFDFFELMDIADCYDCETGAFQFKKMSEYS